MYSCIKQPLNFKNFFLLLPEHSATAHQKCMIKKHTRTLLPYSVTTIFCVKRLITKIHTKVYTVLPK